VVNRRDFLEKKLKFMHEGKWFIYFSSIPDEIQPVEAKITRATTIVGFNVFERLEDGRVRFTALNQTDFNVKGSMAGMARATAVN